ncbi:MULTISPECIES: hypothetical protein [unclassified Ensifer]|uniref:hypothetical protein n=1 Tax=unclassified Ensifer TaxID=2633371 RepID=UPI001160B7DE|nr:hypothetical protein [Ensifer sp. OV372]
MPTATASEVWPENDDTWAIVSSPGRQAVHKLIAVSARVGDMSGGAKRDKELRDQALPLDTLCDRRRTKGNYFPLPFQNTVVSVALRRCFRINDTRHCLSLGHMGAADSHNSRFSWFIPGRRLQLQVKLAAQNRMIVGVLT